MSTLSNNLKKLVAERAKRRSHIAFGGRLARALEWTKGSARIEDSLPLDLHTQVTKGFVGNEPAAIFVADSKRDCKSLLGSAALFAYHSTIEWGVVTDLEEALIFNSHWIRNGSWFYLPAINLNRIGRKIEIFHAITPTELTRGTIDEIALNEYKPEIQLQPVDDELVDRLDHWRDETMRHATNTKDLDRKLQTLFAQFFVLRAVEDRKLLPELESLLEAVHDSEVDVSFLCYLFDKAGKKIQSDLFEERVNLQTIPPFVLAGIIKDLYEPTKLPGDRARYNFAWIEADILGRAYEKYLSTLIIPIGGTRAPQLKLWEQPLREVERQTTARKASGVYYTPSFLVRHITERALDEYFSRSNGLPGKLPKIADISCGSGSFLTVAADSLIRRLRKLEPDRNWGRELIQRNCIVGIDIDPRAVTFARLQLWLRLAEEPKPLPLPRLEQTIVSGDSLDSETWKDLPKQCQIILGNPPFIATGGFQTASELSSKFKTAHGRFDYSYLFVEQALNKLAPNGVLGLVIPNRLFKNNDARNLRNLLTEETEIKSIIDFGSTEVFLGTSSYVGTIILRKTTASDTEKSPLRFTAVYDLPSRFIAAKLDSAQSVSNEVRNEYLVSYDAPPPSGPHEWLLLSPAARQARLKLTDQEDTLSSHAGIFQGIRTGANDIFLVDVEGHSLGPIVTIRNGLGESHLMESDLLKPVIFGSNIQRYDLIRPQKFLLYPYRGGNLITEAELRKDFPRALHYFNAYRSLLFARTSVLNKGKQWYELATQRSEAWLNRKKLLIRDLAVETSFAYDDTGDTYLVGGTAVVPNEESLLLPFLAYLNSKVCNWFLNHITPSFRADFQKFEPKHLENIPIPSELLHHSAATDKLTQLALDALRARESEDVKLATKTDDAINEYIYSMLQIDPQDLL